MILAWKQAYYIARKDLKAYYLKPPLISWGVMLPVVFLLAFYLRNPEKSFSTGVLLEKPGKNFRCCSRPCGTDAAFFDHLHGGHRHYL